MSCLSNIKISAFDEDSEIKEIREIWKKKTPSKAFMTAFRIAATILVFLGAIISAGLAWDTADLLQALMVVINIPVILILTKPAMQCLEDYVAQKKAGKNPEYIADKAVVKVDTDFWK